MTFQFIKATKVQRRLRMALMGPSGSGKTYTALVLAKELAAEGRIAVLDTERNSASLYSDIFEFDSCALSNFNPNHYIAAINAAAEAGYSVIVIDSLSHAWNAEGGVLDQVNSRGGNSFAEWGRVGTPLQNKLIAAILEAPMHVIATMRVKTDYVVERDDRNKSVPRRIGLAAIQRDGVEYEFDIIGQLSIDNTLTIEKTRMVSLSGRIIAKPDGSLAREIMGWLAAGAPAPERTTYIPAATAQIDAHSDDTSQMERRARAIAAMPGTVERDEDRYAVTMPSLTTPTERYEIWKDEKKKVHCTCAEFVELVKENPQYRCEHILIVKFWLEAQQPSQATVSAGQTPVAPAGSISTSQLTSHVKFPANPQAKTKSDLITRAQENIIKQLAQDAGVDADAECMRLTKCKVDELSKHSATLFTEHLTRLCQQKAEAATATAS